MTSPSFALFDTALGACGIVWRGGEILGVVLPEADAAKTRERLGKRFSEAEEAAPPAEIGRVIAAIVALLAGDKIDLSEIALDLGSVPEFDRRVYEIARTIPPGETLTYGEIARRVGTLGDARAVGQALGRNPWPIIVPCHRVLAASGRTGGFPAPGGVDTKLRILTIEARHAAAAPGLFADLPLAAKPRRPR